MDDSTLSSPEIHHKRESCWPEILKRLPPSQLGICLCVSKKWNSLITSKTFISSHTNFISQTQHQSSNLFLLRSFCIENPQKTPTEFYHICYDTKETPKTLETLTNKTFLCPFKTFFGFQFRLVGSVNGVILLTDDTITNTYTLILWNPFVKSFIPLPKPSLCFDAIGPYMHACGFGYDSVNDDFKVVRMVYLQADDNLDEIPPRVELYSVNEGKWRSVFSANVEYCTVDRTWSQCFLKGNVHWVAFERFNVQNGVTHKRNLLLLFNVEKEEFMMMKLPEELREVCPIDLGVSESRGLLCVSHAVTTEMVPGVTELVHFNLWVKTEYNKASSWCKVASVDCRGRLKKAMHWGKSGELLVKSKSNELLSFNLETNNYVVLASGCSVVYDACSFVPSLAFLNKDCKDRRCVALDKDENGNNNDEQLITPEKVLFARMSNHFTRVCQMQKLHREF